MTSPIDWDLAVRIANRTAGQEPLAQSYHYDALHKDFAQATRRAVDFVNTYTGLPLTHDDVSRVIVRNRWVEVNLHAFQALLEPVVQRMAEHQTSSTVNSVGRKFTAVELGALLGWMSRRVVGQYDVFGGDVIYYVGPNVLHLEKKYAFSPPEFRLWIATHEMTHRAQFTGVEWMRSYFLGLIDQLVTTFDPDPKRFFAALRKAAGAARENTAAPREMGLVGYVTTPEQQIVFEKMQALMSVLEGHSEVVMNAAGGDAIPNAERFHHVFHERRMSASGFGGALQRLFGFEAKMRQYQDGADFITAIDSVGGKDAVATLWKSSDRLPSLAELSAPDDWLARVGIVGETTGHEDTAK